MGLTLLYFALCGLFEESLLGKVCLVGGSFEDVDHGVVGGVEVEIYTTSFSLTQYGFL